MKHFTSTCSMWKPYTSHAPLAAEAYGPYSPGCVSGTRAIQLCRRIKRLLLMCQDNQIVLRKIERSCRHPIAPYPDVRYIMVSTPICLLGTDTEMGNPLTGSVYNKVESQLPLFVSHVPDPSAMAVDALSMSWKAMWAYAYPPPALLLRVLEKAQRDQC